MTDFPPTPTPSRDIARLVEIMAALRTPATGCPWDLEQSFATISPYTIEEAYEVADAIERGDMLDLREELGDLLLQVVFHARLAEEEGAFALGDVVHGITTKMIRRHPHVFGGGAPATAEDVKSNWARIKAEEKAERAAERRAMAAAGRARAVGPDDAPVSDAGIDGGVLANVPRALPALTRAIKLQDKAAGVGFDWPSLAPVLDKMREELAELEDAAAAAGFDSRAVPSIQDAAAEPAKPAEPPSRVEEEFGDLLFVMANVARHLQIDPENALRRANAKFERRFAHIEAGLKARGKSPAESDLAEMDALWNEAKSREGL